MINTVTLLGRITRDVEEKVTSGGMLVSTTSIAVNNRRRTNDTLFIEINFFNKLAEISSKYLRKGSKICITGRLNLNQYKSASGTLVQSYQVFVDSLEMLDGASRESEKVPYEEIDKKFKDFNTPSDCGYDYNYDEPPF